MIRYDAGDARRIQHLTKVYEYAGLMGRMERLKKEDQEILEAAAIVHDIGIHRSEEKYGRNTGRYQEIEGPPEAEKLLASQGWPETVIPGSIDRKKNMAATQEDTRRSKVPRRRKSCWPPRDGRKPSYGGWPETVIRRVSYLVGHHHTYTEIDGMDYQLLVEADFLVNLFEEGALPETREDVFRRVSYLVGHHHTYTEIDGMDYQLLVEADFLVNLFEEGALPETREDVFRRIFRTESGKYLFQQIFSQKTE